MLLKDRTGSGFNVDRPDQARTQVVQHLYIPAYVTATLFVVVSLSDIATVALPWNPSAVAWRFGTVGAASNYILTTFFGVVLFAWTAAYFAHGRTLRATSIASIICAFVLMVLLADFALSALQLRNVVAPSEAAAFRIGTAKAAFKYSLFMGAFLMTGVFSWRAGGVIRLNRRNT